MLHSSIEPPKDLSEDEQTFDPFSRALLPRTTQQQEFTSGGVARKSAQAHVQSGKGEEICIVFDLEWQVGQVGLRYAAAIRPIMGVIQRSSSYH